MIAGVAGRYATALFELAREEKQLDRGWRMVSWP